MMDAFAEHARAVESLRCAESYCGHFSGYWANHLLAVRELERVTPEAERAARNIAFALSWCAVRKASERQTSLRIANEVRTIMAEQSWLASSDGDYAEKLVLKLSELVDGIEKEAGLSKERGQ